MKLQTTNPLADLATAIGAGIIAGVAGTMAITISQMTEMKITKRKQGDAPVKAVTKVLKVKPVSAAEKAVVSQEIHWTYGIAWGVFRGLMAYSGLKNWQATAAHFLAIWGTEVTMLPGMKLAPPLSRQKPKDISVDVIHHVIYALAAGVAYDAITHKDLALCNLKKIWK